MRMTSEVLKALCASRSIEMNKERRTYFFECLITHETRQATNLDDGYEIYKDLVQRQHTKTYFKLVRKNKKGLCSHIGRPCEVTYKVGKCTTPEIPHSKLFVFNTPESLHLFLPFATSYDEIMLCKVVNPSKALEMGHYPEDYWLNKFFNKTNKTREVPKGTIFCDAVIPFYILNKEDKKTFCSYKTSVHLERLINS